MSDGKYGGAFEKVSYVVGRLFDGVYRPAVLVILLLILEKVSG